VQSRGTAAVAAWFGPITFLWFIALAAGGLAHLVDDPSILAALSPAYGVRFLSSPTAMSGSWPSAPCS
jgi:KUP system potassium uptake protein